MNGWWCAAFWFCGFVCRGHLETWFLRRIARKDAEERRTIFAKIRDPAVRAMMLGEATAGPANRSSQP